MKGGTIDRVFSKTVIHETDLLRCSDGIILPKSFLSLFNTEEKNQALKLLRKGLLIVSVCSAPGYFSKQNKRAEKFQEQVIATDPSHLVFNQGSPRDDETEP